VSQLQSTIINVILQICQETKTLRIPLKILEVARLLSREISEQMTTKPTSEPCRDSRFPTVSKGRIADVMR
jgi:hypothetical protein